MGCRAAAKRRIALFVKEPLDANNKVGDKATKCLIQLDIVKGARYARPVAADRDRFGHCLGKRWKKVGDLILYSPDEAPQLVSEYVDSALLGLLSRRGLEALLQSLARADELRATRLLQAEDPEYTSKLAAIQQCEPRVAQMALEALRIAEASNGSGPLAINAFAGVAAQWVISQCAIQRPYSADRQLQDAISARRKETEGQIRVRLRARLQQQRLHKPKRRSSTVSLMNRDVVVVGFEGADC